MDIWREFSGPNAAYVLELYERFRQNPDLVDPATRQFFGQWTPPAESPSVATVADTQKIVAVVNLAQAIRAYGHRAARLDPLGSKPPGAPSLSPDAYALSADALRQMPAQLVGGPAADNARNAAEAIE